ncbi:MAG: SUMF1/EgtB/PvdO family nonheme iron enzyme [Bacteriovoracaceae bacterium]|nr:SUMF1/EgtB/PvdO family nonheme iron enzyme [Bacteriovoracaceae bacterium]
MSLDNKEFHKHFKNKTALSVSDKIVSFSPALELKNSEKLIQNSELMNFNYKAAASELPVFDKNQSYKNLVIQMGAFVAQNPVKLGFNLESYNNKYFANNPFSVNKTLEASIDIFKKIYDLTKSYYNFYASADNTLDKINALLSSHKYLFYTGDDKASSYLRSKMNIATQKCNLLQLYIPSDADPLSSFLKQMPCYNKFKEGDPEYDYLENLWAYRSGRWNWNPAEYTALAKVAITDALHNQIDDKYTSLTKELGGQDYEELYLSEKLFATIPSSVATNKPESVSTFDLLKTEVTQGSWSEVMGTFPWMDNSHKAKKGAFGKENYPATYVSWYMARNFVATLNQCPQIDMRSPHSIKRGILDQDNCQKQRIEDKKLVYRLPTQKEWEHAASSFKRIKNFDYFVLQNDPQSYNQMGLCSGQNQFFDVFKSFSPAAVAQLNKSQPLGLFDMHGNVSEWSNDLIGSAGHVGHVGPAKGITKGGSVKSTPVQCLSHNQEVHKLSEANSTIGFRVAVTKPDIKLVAPPRNR